MKQYSFYSPETGNICNVIYTGTEPELNAPPGCAVLEGHFNHCTHSVRMEPDESGVQKPVVYERDVHLSDPRAEFERERVARLNRVLTPEQIISNNRRSEYPPIEDQLDALWKGGAESEAMRQKITAIKLKFPKVAI